MKEFQDLETHPWEPFIPDNAKVLIMGTFPPGAHRWSMNFYYPNRTNDFWYMMGLIFKGDRNALLIPGEKDFNLDAIKELLCEKGIAMYDTVYRKRPVSLPGSPALRFPKWVHTPIQIQACGCGGCHLPAGLSPCASTKRQPTTESSLKLPESTDNTFLSHFKAIFKHINSSPVLLF